MKADLKLYMDGREEKGESFLYLRYFSQSMTCAAENNHQLTTLTACSKNWYFPLSQYKPPGLTSQFMEGSTLAAYSKKTPAHLSVILPHLQKYLAVLNSWYWLLPGFLSSLSCLKMQFVGT